jgi:hypothetical protein
MIREKMAKPAKIRVDSFMLKNNNKARRANLPFNS